MSRSAPYDVQSVGLHKHQQFVDVGNEESISRLGLRANDMTHQYRTPGMPQTTDDTSEAYISRTLYICKLPPDFTATQINEVLSPYGDIRKITCYPSRQIAFAEFWDLRDAQKARNGLKDVQIGGRSVEIQYSKTRDDRSKEKNTGTLYVRPITTERNFRDPNTLQQYKELFNRYGEVKKVNTNRKREAEKFIEYHDLRSAEAALEGLNGMDFNGVKLEVQFANQSSKTINKEGFFFDAPFMNMSRSHQFRKESAPSYGPSRTEPVHGISSAPQSYSYKPEVHAHSPYWSGPPIKMHWSGTCGPRAMMASGSSGMGANVNGTEFRHNDPLRNRVENNTCFSMMRNSSTLHATESAPNLNLNGPHNHERHAPSSVGAPANGSQNNFFAFNVPSSIPQEEPWATSYNDVQTSRR